MACSMADCRMEEYMSGIRVLKEMTSKLI